MREIRSLIKQIVPYKKELLLGSAATLLYSGADLLFPWGTKLFFDHVLVQKNLDWVSWITALLVVGVVARLSFAFLKNYLSEIVAEKSLLHLKRRLTQHLFRLSVRSIERTSSGQITNLFSHDMECLRRFFSEALSQVLFSFLYLAVLIGFLVWIDPFLALYSLLYLPIVGAAFVWIGKGEKKDLFEVKSLKGNWLSRFQRVLVAMPTVLGYAKHLFEQKKLYSFSKETLKLSLKSHRRKALFQASGEALASVGLIALLFLGSFAVINNRLTIGQLMAFYIVFGYLFIPIGRMISFYEPYKDALTSFKRIEYFLKQEPKRKASSPIFLEKQWRGDLSFEAVDFSYGPRKILNNITLSIQSGEKVAIVGKSGVGKTTLLRLLCGFESPDSGTIWIGEQKLSQLEELSYLNQLGIVFQEDHFMEESIEENILYGVSQATQKEWNRAIQIAGLEETLKRLPKGKQSLMGDGGVQLSGGERKRIALARALIKQPKFLILDEPTAPLDSQNESYFQEIFSQSVYSGSVLLVTHRLSTLMQVDRVYLLDQGSIVEQGSPEDLLSKGGAFVDLFDNQLTRVAKTV